MELFIFIAHMGVGGAERVCVTLANEFIRCGYDVHIIVLNLENDVNTQLLDPKCKVSELGVSRLRYAAIPMIKFIKKYKPAKIMVFGQEMAVILNQLRKLHLIKTKIMLRVLNNTNITLEKEDNISPIVEKTLVKTRKQMNDMESVIVQCKAMGEMLLIQGYVDKSRMTAIYNPVSQYLVDTVNRNSNINMGCKQIIFVGRLDPQKNVKHLIEAFARVVKKDDHVVLRLVGDGILKEQLQEQVIELNLENKVIFDGIRKDMERVYEEATIMALSSLYEGMPNCLIEAISVGIPVVSYDCPMGPKEIVQDGINGYLVDFENVDQLSERMLCALTREWNHDAIKDTAQKFQVQMIAQEYLEVYQNM